MKNILHFKRESITYYAIGQPADYYYDLGLIPLDNFPCDDILEKSRLLYALWEIFFCIDINKPNRVLTHSLVVDLSKYFEQYDAPDFAYWALLHYETINGDDSSWWAHEIEDETNNLILHGGEIKLFIPPPYDNVIDEDGNDVNEIIGSSAKSLSFSQNIDFPFLFMSNQQKDESEIEINKYYEEIFAIFQKHNFQISKCEELLKIYEKISD
jgi:hypothetical protein